MALYSNCCDEQEDEQTPSYKFFEDIFLPQHLQVFFLS